ncbi:hypothetical protein ACS0TY_007557 [Phlomoides rotata]
MPVKRSRAGSSSSAYIDTLVAATASVSHVKAMKTDAAAEPSRAKLAIASPVNVDHKCDQMKIGGFLERCHYCKKRIAQDSEVFMYGNFCAFCSDACRDIVINMDQSAEKKQENRK